MRSNSNSMASNSNTNDTTNTTSSNTANPLQPPAIATPTHRDIFMAWYLPVAVVGTCLLPCIMMLLVAKSMIQRMDKNNNLEQRQLEDVEVRSVAPTVTSDDDDDDDDLDIEFNNIGGEESTDVG